MTRGCGLAGGRACGWMTMVVMVCALTCSAAAQEQMGLVPGVQESWPRQFITPEGRVAIYQPQLETVSEGVVTARAAVAVTRPLDEHPQFGAAWIQSSWVADSARDVVELVDVRITRARFHSVNEVERESLERIVTSLAPTMPWEVTTAQWKQMLAMMEQERAAAAQIQSPPPRIIFSNEPAVLVLYDGEPQVSPIEKTALMRVVNTPFFVVLDLNAKAYFLHGGGRWYQALDPLGPWIVADEVPAAVTELVRAAPTAPLGAGGPPAGTEQAGLERPGESDFTDFAVMPRIITATEPTELIVIDGQPRFTPIANSSLLYLANSRSNVLLDIDSQQLFVLLSGRWFAAPSKDGPWSFVPANQLPAGFARIPAGSPAGTVLTHVAGTNEAEQALLDTAVPRVAAVKRETVALDVVYDGEPQFAPIEGTNMMYAVNTPYSIVLVNSTYYCCAQAVWYQSDTPFGPWVVCTSIPAEIHTIPPSCPIYPVRFVEVYETTDDWVYSGYTPGYLGSFVTTNTVVFGTGFWHRPWCGNFWWSWPSTFGWGVCWSPWSSRWSFSFGFGSCFSWCGIGGWWGCGWPCSWSWCAWSCWDWSCSPTTVCAVTSSGGVVVSGGVVAGGVAVGGTVAFDSQAAPGSPETPPSAGVTGMFGNAGARLAAAPVEKGPGSNTGSDRGAASARAGLQDRDNVEGGRGASTNAAGPRRSRSSRVTVVNAADGGDGSSGQTSRSSGGLVNGDTDWRGSRAWSDSPREESSSAFNNDLATGSDLVVDQAGNVYRRSPRSAGPAQGGNDSSRSWGNRAGSRGVGSGLTFGRGMAPGPASGNALRSIGGNGGVTRVAPPAGSRTIIRTRPNGPMVPPAARPAEGVGGNTIGGAAPPTRRVAPPPSGGVRRIAPPSGPSRAAPPPGARSMPPGRSAPSAVAPRPAMPRPAAPAGAAPARGGGVGPATGGGGRAGGGGGAPAGRGGGGGNAGGKR